MGVAQDAPPNPQQRVGKIGGRPSRHHDAPSPRVPCQQQHPHQGQQPNHPAAHHAPKAATHRGAPASRPLGSAATALPCKHLLQQHPQRHGRAQRNPEQARVGGAQPAGAGNQQALLDEQHVSPQQVSARGRSPSGASSSAARPGGVGCRARMPQWCQWRSVPIVAGLELLAAMASAGLPGHPDHVIGQVIVASSW